MTIRSASAQIDPHTPSTIPSLASLHISDGRRRRCRERQNKEEKKTQSLRLKINFANNHLAMSHHTATVMSR